MRREVNFKEKMWLLLKGTINSAFGLREGIKRRHWDSSVSAQQSSSNTLAFTMRPHQVPLSAPPPLFLEGGALKQQPDWSRALDVPETMRWKKKEFGHEMFS